ncbi:MAG: helix-turn-helix domain-containing protein [Myxococcota bacterium]
MLDVTVLLTDGGHASTALGPLEVFRDAGRLWNALQGKPESPRFRVRTATPGRRPVRPDAPYTILPDEALEDVGETDLVFVPSIGLDPTFALAANAELIPFIRDAHSRGSRVAGVCSGVALLAASEILDGRRATTHWGLAADYRIRFPRVLWQPEQLVTEDGGVCCGGGVHASIDLAIFLVEKLCGREVAIECARSLVVDMPRACQAGFSVLPIGSAHADAAIARAEEWIHAHCREPIRFDALAQRLAMSPRNFIRRFGSATGLRPVEYLQKLRIRAARHDLEQADAGVEEIGRRVGYDDVAFFRRVFKRETGLTPSAYRKQFALHATLPNGRKAG